MKHFRGRFGGPGRWRRRFLLAVALLVLVLGTALFLVAHPRRVGALAGEVLSSLLGAEVRIESARLGLDGSVDLRNVVLRIPDVPGEAGRLLEAPHVLVRHDLWSLLRGRFVVRSFAFPNVTFWRTEDLATGKFNYDLLRERRDPQPRRLPTRLPEVLIRQGAVRCGEIDQGSYAQLGDLLFTGQLAQSAEDAKVYRFLLRPLREDGQEQDAIEGGLNLRERSFFVNADRFSFEAPVRTVMPARIRRWWDALEPEGKLPRVRVDYDEKAGGFGAVLEVSDAQLTLPYGAAAFRMTGGSGRFVLRGSNVQVQELRGVVEGVPYQIDGQARGLDLNAPFEMSIQTQAFSVPEDPEDLPALPPELFKQFKRFSPSGSFSALVFVSRREVGGRVSYTGKVSLLEARLRYARFAYPLQNLRGEIRFSDERVEVSNLTAQGPTGAKFNITGTIAPPIDGAAVHLQIEAHDLPADEHLDAALRPQEKAVLDLFRDQEAYDRLTRANLVQSSESLRQATEQLRKVRWELGPLRDATDADPAAIAALQVREARLLERTKIPAFDLGGKVSLSITVDRPLGEDSRYRNTVDINLAGVGVLFRHWPYPLTVQRGRVSLDPDRVVVTQQNRIEAVGLSGARGSLVGTVGLPTATDRMIAPDLAIAAVAAPVDELLIASLPQAHGELLRSVALRGQFEAQAKVFRQGDQVAFEVLASPDQLTAQPLGGGYPLTDLEGELVIRHRQVEARQISARHGATTLTMNGQALWQGDQPRFDLTFTASGGRFEDPVLDLLPPQNPHRGRLLALFEKHRPAGGFDATLLLRNDEKNTLGFDLDLRPTDVALDLHGQRLEMTEMTGSLACAPWGIEARDLRAKIDRGELSVDGYFAFDKAAATRLTLGCRAQALTPAACALMPQNILRVLRGVNFAGGYELRDALFTRGPDDRGVVRESFAGEVQLHDASLTAGVPITDLQAALSLRTERVQGEEWPSVDVALEASRLRVAKRLVEPLSLRLDNSADPQLLTIHEMRGRAYEGTLLGRGQFDLRRGGEFSATLTLQNAQLGPLLSPEKDPTQTRDQGVLSATLSLQGTPGRRETYEGRGEFAVSDAALFRFPVGMAVLHVVNMSWPAAESFDRASASFLLDGNVLRFDSVRFEAPTVEVVGDGTLLYDSRELNLLLHSRNPGGGRSLGAVSDMLNLFKDQLLSVRVTGTLDQPKSAAESFGGVKRSWEEVFGKDRARKPAPGSPPGVTQPAGGAAAASVEGQ